MPADPSDRPATTSRAGESSSETAHLKELVAVPPTREYLQRMWEMRDFIAALPAERLRTTHQATLLGNAWHLANPILSIIVYYVIFGVLLDVSRNIDNYIFFLVIGVFVFRESTQCLMAGAQSITTNGGLIRSIRFPRAALPVSYVLSRLMTFSIELCIIAGLAVVTGEGIHRRWVLLPFVVAVHTGFNLGVAFYTARLNDTFQDVQQIIPFLMQLMRYASGVMFSIHALTADSRGWVQTIVRWNPYVTILDLYRWLFMGSPVAFGGVVRFVLVAAAALWFGFRYFAAAEQRYGRG